MNTPAPLLSGAPNFRDLGGYATQDGRRVRRGRLFRSELLLQLEAQDLHTLAQLDIALVCDLRTPGERRRLQNRWPEGRAFETLALDNGEHAHLAAVQPDRWTDRLADPAFGAEQAQAALADNYRRMPASYARDLAQIFLRLEQPQAPSLMVHCAAGKDRTGFVSAMLLFALGVDRDAVFQDYLLTQRFYTYERMRTMLSLLKPHLAPQPHAEGALRMLSSVQPEFLDAALDSVHAAHGSVERYLLDACGLTPERREALRARFTEA